MTRINSRQRRREATYRRGYEDGKRAALSSAEPVEQEENPMRFFADNVDKWGALEWFNRMVDACEDHDRKRLQAFGFADADERDMHSLSADTSKMIMSSSAFQLSRNHKDEIRSALSAQVQNVAGTSAADQIIGQIEEIFPNWPKYRDLIDCIICELHELRQRAEGQNNG